MTTDEILVSSERHADVRDQLGGAHYSYTFVESRFSDLFRRLGLRSRVVKDPQALKLPEAEAKSAIHVAFRSSENLRLVSGASNICHFAWEFDVLKADELPSRPILTNQVHMLGLFDEIWVPSNYTLKVLHAHGLRQAVLVPTPVCDAVPARLSGGAILTLLGEVPVAPLCLTSEGSEQENLDLVRPKIQRLAEIGKIVDVIGGGPGKIFLAIVNPGDMRKNILNVIDGFRAAKRDGDMLIIKLIVSNRGDHLADAQFRYLRELYRGPVAVTDDSVLFLTSYLEWPQMEALYSLANFYISGSLCEGFNLPLIEAMSLGSVPLATNSTAMADYIFDDNAILVNTRRVAGYIPGPRPMAGDVAGRAYAVDVASRFEIAQAVRRAQTLSREQERELGEGAQRTVTDLYSFEAVGRLVGERLSQGGADRPEIN